LDSPFLTFWPGFRPNVFLPAFGAGDSFFFVSAFFAELSVFSGLAAHQVTLLS